MVIERPYGSWPSPVTPELVVSASVSPREVRVEGDVIWWSEVRPAEQGRTQIVRRDPDGSVHEVLPDGWNARTRVHEYGGAAWWVDRGRVLFSNWADQRVYVIDEADGAGAGAATAPASEPRPITPEPPVPHAWRYADARVTPDGTTVVCVREAHEGDVVHNEVVAFPIDGSVEPRLLVIGRDFVSSPRISRDGKQLAWLAWDHPDMPWDGTELWVARLERDAGGLTLSSPRREAGGRDEALGQPEWGRHGHLFVVSDRDEWWNVYRVDGLDQLTALHPVAAEVGLPAWNFGGSRYGITADGSVVMTYSLDGHAHVAVVREDGTVSSCELDCIALSQLRITGERFVAVASSATVDDHVVAAPIADPSALVVLRPPADLGLDPAGISRPEHITFPTSGGREAHAWFYPPTSAMATAPVGSLPPLVVMIHGGPTGAARPTFDLDKQFWTSRGFAVADVDYGGSTGYGRTYRRQLDGAWGIVDVDDCCAAADHLARAGRVDPERMAITGGSAGGFTVLTALALRDTFVTGASHYGVTDLRALARDTHKFESRYLDGLVGVWPDDEAVYVERSPITHVDRFHRPLLVLQGLEDEVVPPSQAEAIVAALAAKGVPHAYLPFEGEQHGFRRAENVIRALTAELSFYGQVFGFVPDGDVPPVAIEFADALT
jgi:dipeptidyl aminopeptidase/acylaminoacyl peptidase